jgi:3-hydroxyisobutyrate dehydrogenase-like beta-hydroxyacid dehydrogenase
VVDTTAPTGTAIVSVADDTGVSATDRITQDTTPTLSGTTEAGSAVEIFVKDLGLVNDMARGLNFPVPLAAQAQQLFTAARAMGQGGADDGFVIRVWQAITGIDLPGDEKNG